MFRFVGSAAFLAGVLEAAAIEVANGPSTRSECLFTFSSPYYTNGDTVTIPVGTNGLCQPDGHGNSVSTSTQGTNCFPQDFDASGGCPNVTECSLQVLKYRDDQCTSLVGSTLCNVTENPTSDQPGSCNGVLTTGPSCAESLFHAGWDCFDDVLWAKNTGIHQHPEWYGSLTASSSIEEFHSYISALPICSPEQPPPCAAHSCTRPCYQYQTQEYVSCSVSFATFSQIQNVCVPDGNGGSNIVWYNGNPDDYCHDPGYMASVRHYPNSFCTGESDRAWSVFTDGDPSLGSCCNIDASTCGLDCRPSAWFGTCPGPLSPDSECAGQMRWAMTEGIHQHPEWYPGLSVDSSFQDFQLYLSGLPRCSENGSLPPCYGGSESCPTPCINNRVSSWDAGDAVV